MPARVSLRAGDRPQTNDSVVQTDAETRAAAAWVTAAQSGDRSAFERLYRLFVPVVHGVLLARAPGPEADDLVQEVFLTAWSRLDSLRDAAAFGAWLCAIARHKATTRGRGRVSTAQLPEGLSAPPQDDNRRDFGAAALAAIRSLPEAYRETLVLRLVEGLSGPQIAACTGLTPGSVRVNLHRGMVLLRERLGDQR